MVTEAEVSHKQKACSAQSSFVGDEDLDNLGTHLTNAVRLALVPLSLLLFFLLFVILYRLLNLPQPDELIRLAEKYYELYGYWVVFIAALLEGLLLINWYLPGSVIIVLGVTLGRQVGLNVGVLVGLVIVAFFIDYMINYALGRYGWYRLFVRFGLKSPLQRIKRRVERHGLSVVFVTYFHPNTGALTATSCGILHLPFRAFVLHSIAATIVWNTLWGTVVYFAGPALIDLLNMWLIVPLLVIWAGFLIARAYRTEKKRRTNNNE
jgi:membrane protein DedA with SNARE-associated domain